MGNIVKKIAGRIGMDKAVAYSSGARVVQAVAGVFSVFFLTMFLTKVEMGFYYTFGSIVALQVFFELGLTGIMTQYVAHEVSHLREMPDFTYEGDEKYRSRLASLLRFCVKWYTVVALLTVAFLLVFGFFYFGRYSAKQNLDVPWQVPWVLICAGTGLKLFIAPFNSILLGLGKVEETSEISFWQQIAGPLVIWGGLALGWKLYVVGISYLATILIWLVFVGVKGYFRIFEGLWKVPVTEKVGYMAEIFPYQWKIALSWISGYFIFQLFNPVLFATDGAAVAGQMGMTLTALNAIQAFSMSWINTKIPMFSGMIAREEYDRLDKVFNKTVRQMAGVCVFLVLCFLFCIWLFRFTGLAVGGNVVADRFLDWGPMALMILPMMANIFVNAWATYLRCHKQEPFLAQSIVMGVSCMLSTLVLGRIFGLWGITAGYCLLTLLIALPWGLHTFVTKKKEWHPDKLS